MARHHAPRHQVDVLFEVHADCPRRPLGADEPRLQHGGAYLVVVGFRDVRVNDRVGADAQLCELDRHDSPHRLVVALAGACRLQAHLLHLAQRAHVAGALRGGGALRRQRRQRGGVHDSHLMHGQRAAHQPATIDAHDEGAPGYT